MIMTLLKSYVGVSLQEEFLVSPKDEVFLKDNGRTTVKSLKKG